MAAENPATPSDVAARWRSLTTAEEDQSDVLLEAAWAALTVQAPAVVGYESASLGETLIIYVLVTAVLRVMKNPDGAKSETIDDYSFTRDDSAAVGLAGSLWFTDDELALVRGESKPRAVSVSMDPAC